MERQKLSYKLKEFQSCSYLLTNDLKPHLRRVISLLENVLCLPCRVSSHLKRTRVHLLRCIFSITFVYRIYFLINFDISLLFRRLYSRNSVYVNLQFGPYSVIFFRKRCIFCGLQRLYEIRTDQPVFWSTNTVRSLCSFLALFVPY